MSKIKSKILAVAAALALTGGVGTAGVLGTAVTASAATPSCGANCVNMYVEEYAGSTLTAPQFVLDVFQRHIKIGQPVILFRSSNADPAEDWTYANQGTVADFYQAGLVSSALALHYGCTTTVVDTLQIPCAPNGTDDEAYEIEYAPNGVDSGLCLGLATTAVSGEGVSLQECGTSARTVWVQDIFSNDASPSLPPGGPDFWAAINGSDTDFSNPFVLTYPADAYPTDKPRAQLEVDNLQQFSQGSPADYTTQLWTAFAGVLP
jgi:hypothetical protein